jgi:predicted O-methyltransferase YrrM
MGNQETFVFRPFMDTPESVHLPWIWKRLRHPLFAWARMRPIFAQHTRAEDEALQRNARGRRVIVEIGVAEGASALVLRQVMATDGTLYLIDPYHLSRYPWINAPKRAAKAAVSRCHTGEVIWIEQFSSDAARAWNRPIDFLFLDGNHTLEFVSRDWEEWHRFIKPGGRLAFHDARIFENGWPRKEDGPVKLVDSLFRNQHSPNWKIVEEVHSLVIVERLECQGTS